jgi:L-lactate dehydrogenase
LETDLKTIGNRPIGNPPERIAIIGCGHVGATSAYALMLSGVGREIVLIDKDVRRAEGEAMDLQQAVPLAGSARVWAGDYVDAARASITVIAVGVNSRPGESRLDLLERNVVVIRDCVRNLMAMNFDGIILMTTNPVDILAQIAQKESGLPVEQVIGSGTVLDSARMRSMIAAEIGIEPRSIHAYVVGEHGDSEVAAWSSTRIAGLPIEDFCLPHKCPDYIKISRSVRRAAPEIVERKGYTSFAVASCVSRVCQAVLRDEHIILPVSTMMKGEYGIDGVYLSTPCVIGRRGVERVVELNLSSAELEGLRSSAEVLRSGLAKLGNSAAPYGK